MAISTSGLEASWVSAPALSFDMLENYRLDAIACDIHDHFPDWGRNLHPCRDFSSAEDWRIEFHCYQYKLTLLREKFASAIRLLITTDRNIVLHCTVAVEDPTLFAERETCHYLLSEALNLWNKFLFEGA